MDKLITKNIVDIIEKMAKVIIKNEIPFCDLDSHAGDGDFGMSLAKGFKQVKSEFDSISKDDIGNFLKETGMIITEYCGGASGPIWGSAFRSAGKYAMGKTEINLEELSLLLQSAIDGVQKRGGAKLGDKTLLDALIPATESLKESVGKQLDIVEAMKISAKEAVLGAENTKNIVATKGRATYVGERSINHPDAGATAIGIIFTEISNMFN